MDLMRYRVKYPAKNKNGVSHVCGAKASASVITKGNAISVTINSSGLK
jgi:hypothetical protein